jgi:hypothetical protein|tara:strand:+ start:976 stop:1278 length:303 start_codon:yes stop_codon:yes gene_type:complete
MARLSLLPKGTDQFNFVGRDPIKALWRNVLLVALEDAIKERKWRNRSYGVNCSSQSAQEYFLYPSKDFQMVCTLAGFDHQYIRRKARRKFEDVEKNMHSV